MEDRGTTKREGQTANPGYAAFQIARALTTAEQHDDPATRERARQRVEKWASVLQGMTSGEIAVGSRTPLKVPGWATPEVVTGGFATGELLAGGPLLEHERVLLEQLSAGSAPEPRRVLNAYFLTDQGLARLGEWLSSGRYEISVPEEAALLVVAWLVVNGHAEAARRLLDDIAPFFDRWRFYPVPTERPGRTGTRVFLQDVGRTVGDLERIKPNLRVLAQKEAIQVWAPLYDCVVSLFLETVDGEVPTLVAGPDGKFHPAADGKHAVIGGWPCRRYAGDWPARAREALEAYRHQRQDHALCTKPDRRKENFAQLRDYLQRCVDDPASLTGRDVGRIRLILARYIAKRGEPGSARCMGTREVQLRNASLPTFRDIAGIVVQRLNQYPRDSGLDDPSVVAHPVTAEEASRSNVAGGAAVPPSLDHKLQRCLAESVDVLVERGIITSAEVLARLLPQITSGLQAAGIADSGLRQLYAAVYQAFRKRRSLLLLNLESQVRIEELPWVAAIDGFRRADLPAQDLARQTLEDMTVLTLSSFPHAIIPNKLLQELRALATTAKLGLPLVDEVAADIFMGRFSPKFRESAKRAAGLLKGTLYEAYYGIDYDQLSHLPEPARSRAWRWFRRAIPGADTDSFADLCARRAGVQPGGWDPATNGMIIEQQQIVTSQNLAVLFGELGLVGRLQGQLEGFARDCFTWICRRQQMFTTERHAALIKVKNTAYAWRQMIFFLALLPKDRIMPFLSWAEAHLAQQPSSGFRARFSPALRGLALAVDGRSLDDPSSVEVGARRFLGWSKEKHWLM